MVIFPSEEQATLCRYREMMLLKMKAEGYKLSWLLIHATTCLDRNQCPDVCVCKGGERTLKASISQLYYVPAFVSSLMQSRCPPNVTRTRANVRTRTRCAGFCSPQKIFFYCSRISSGTERFIFLEAYLFNFSVLLFFPRVSSAQVCLIHKGLSSVNARDRSVISR